MNGGPDYSKDELVVEGGLSNPQPFSPVKPAEGGEEPGAEEIGSSVHESVESQMLRRSVLDGFGWKKLLQMPISAHSEHGSQETLEDRLIYLRDFVEQRKAELGVDDFSEFEKACLNDLKSLLQRNIGLDRDGVRANLRNVDVYSLHSKTELVDEDSAGSVRRVLHERLKADWESRPFAKVPAFGGDVFNYRIGQNHPRYFNLTDEDFVESFSSNPKDPKEAIAYMIYSALAEKMAIEAARTKGAPGFHRQSQLVAQRACALFLEDAHTHNGLKYNCPSLTHFGRSADLKDIKKYLDSMIGLCVSESHVVATDVISKDLKMLLEIYGKRLQEDYGVDYQKVLTGLATAVEISYRLYTDLDLGLTRPGMKFENEDQEKNHWSMLRVIESMKRKIAEGRIKGYSTDESPVIWSLGHGDSVFERYLAKNYDVRVSGYDVYYDQPGSIRYDDPERNFARVYTKDEDPDIELKAFEAGLEHLKQTHGGQSPSILFCGDVLHHIHPNVRFKALKRLYDQVPSGGFLVIDEPTYCKAYDEVSRKYAHPLDSTSHEMVSSEDMNTFIAYATLRGGEVRSCDMNPFALKNDVFWRNKIVIRKGYPKRDLPFRSLDENQHQVESLRDLYKISPFKLLGHSEDLFSAAARNLVMETFWTWAQTKRTTEGDQEVMTADEAREMFLRWKFNSQDNLGLAPAKIRARVTEKAPYDPAYLEPILDLVGGDHLMMTRLTRAGYIVAIVDELSSMKCLDESTGQERNLFGISRKDLAKQPTWETFSAS